MTSSSLRKLAFARLAPTVLIATLIATILFAVPASVLAQGGGAQKSVNVPRIVNQEPVIDGVLDDPIWQQATQISDLYQVFPVDGAAPSERSIFYIAYDENNFYMAARLYDSEPEAIAANVMIQGGILRFDDNVHLFLDTFNNDRTAFRFITNPNAIRDDGIFESPTRYNSDWSGIWFTQSQIDDEGWTTEMAIPFTTLNFDPNTTEWGFNLEREIARKNERLVWSAFNRVIDPSTSGQVVGLQGLEQGLGLDIVPSVTVSSSEDHITDATDSSIDPSLDVFYKFTPNLTGVLTINTDFSSTEVDDRQVNLTRFNLFFPEKRDFFLQDAEIFSFGGLAGGNNGIPFYSRRIGLDAGSGQPVDIDVGGKLAGRVGNLSVGTLLVQQEDRVGVSDDPLFVGRVTQNVLGESRIGAIFTSGDPNSLNDNSLYGVDFRYRNTRLTDIHTLTSDFWYQQSDTDGLEGDDKAYSASMDISTQSTGLSGSLGYNYVGAQYNPALGFTNRRGVEQLNGEFDTRYYFNNRPILQYYSSTLDVSHTRRIDNGDMQSESVSLRPLSLTSHQGDVVYFQVDREREGLTTAFTISPGVVIPAGTYDFNSAEIGIATTNLRSFSPDFSYTDGDFYDGKRRVISTALNWIQGPRFNASFRYTYTDVELPQGEFTTRLVSLNTTYAINAMWSWINLVQYDNNSDTVGINSRLHWDPRAGEDFYLVVNYNFDADGVFNGLSTRQSEIVLKYSRNFRF